MLRVEVDFSLYFHVLIGAFATFLRRVFDPKRLLKPSEGFAL